MYDDPIISKIFPEEKDIYLSKTFINEVKNRRLKRSYINKNMIYKQEQYIKFKNLSELKTGLYSTDINNAHFNFFFYKGIEKKLIICLNGARTQAGGIPKKVPIYNRWSFYNLTHVSWLSLEDPMYFKCKDLLLGWYYGDQDNDFRYLTSLLIKKIASILNIEQNNIILYGSSGGGTAALDIACKLGNCTAVSINGQYNFEYKHKNIDDFYKQTGIDLHKIDKFDRNNICKILNNSTVKYILIENCKSEWDYTDHLHYLCQKLNIVPRFGISKFNNIYIYI